MKSFFMIAIVFLGLSSFTAFAEPNLSMSERELLIQLIERQDKQYEKLCEMVKIQTSMEKYLTNHLNDELRAIIREEVQGLSEIEKSASAAIARLSWALYFTLGIIGMLASCLVKIIFFSGGRRRL